MQKPDVVLIISALADLKLAVDVAALSGVTGSPGVKQHSQPSLELLACRTCLPEQGESLHLLLLLSCSNELRQSQCASIKSLCDHMGCCVICGSGHC